MRLKRLLIYGLISLTALLSFKAVDDYFEISKNLDIFASVYKEVNTSYVDEVKPGELIRAAIDGMLRSLDPYTVFYSEAQAEDYRFQLTGTYAGIGSTVRDVDGFVVIDMPHEGYPAAEAGLHAGDRILSIDGESMKDKDLGEVRERLKGNAGTMVLLELERPGGDAFEVTLERQQIETPNVPYHGLLENGVGFIKLTNFTRGASGEVKLALKNLKDQGASSIILDLRGNGGGLLHEAIDIVNIFVPRGQTVVVTKGKLKEEQHTYRTLNLPLDTEIPLVVFIDERSASASEIVSGALQDLDRAILIGRNSFGKGLVQGSRSLTYNSQMKVTIAKYYLPSGRLIQRLDYGSKVRGRAQAVADSLKTTFYTENGRPVIDGEGIHPDIDVEMPPYSKVAEGLLRSNLAFKWACLYRNTHALAEGENVPQMNDAMYEEFLTYMSEQELEYQTDTEKQLEKLKQRVEAEAFSEATETSIAALEQDIQTHKAAAFEVHRDEIMELLEYELFNCYKRAPGKVEASFDDDPDLEEAYILFKDPQRKLDILKVDGVE